MEGSDSKQRKQRNRRRERAQRMRESNTGGGTKDGDSAEDDDVLGIREKPQRPNRRKKSKELTAAAAAAAAACEEDIIDGFAILAFRTYEELESAMKAKGVKVLGDVKPKPVVDTGQRNNNHHPANITPLTMMDAGTSDDSGRASERLHTSRELRDSSHDRLSEASSHCSSSGNGYICDSEGDDDKGSDAGSDLFTTTRKHELPGHAPPPLTNGSTTPPSPPPPSPPPAAPPPRLPSPALAPPPAPPPPRLATPPPNGPAVLSNGPIPPMPVAVAVSAAPAAANGTTPPPPTLPAPPPVAPVPPPAPCRAASSPAVALASGVPGGFAPFPAYPPLYTPYSATMHSPYLPPGSPRTSDTRASRSPCPVTAKQPPPPPLHTSGGGGIVASSLPPVVSAVPACGPLAQTPPAPAHGVATLVQRESAQSRSHSPRGHSPTRERDSYSSNVSSLSRSSVTTPGACVPASPFGPPPPVALAAPAPVVAPPAPVAAVPPPASSHSVFASKLQAPPLWVSSSNGPQSLSPAVGMSRPPPPSLMPASAFPSPLFPPTSSAGSTAPAPFSAESLFQSSQQSDLLRRELDNRFLASQERGGGGGVSGPALGAGAVPPPYLRTEMHHHQHQHTHVHQHAGALAPQLFPPPPAPQPPPPPLFKEIPKLGSVESPFYRQPGGLVPGYPGYPAPGLMHAATPFAPPSHLASFTPKQISSDPTKPKLVKSGRWNAMHVRIAWEIYHHQQKQQAEAKAAAAAGNGAGGKGEMLRPPSHIFAPPPPRPHELPPGFGLPPSPHRAQFDPAAAAAAAQHGYLSAQHLVGGSMSPFGRYPGFPSPSPGFPGMAGFPPPPPRDHLPPLSAMGPVHDPWGRLPPARGGSFAHGWALKPEPSPLDRRAELEERERERERERCRRERDEARERERQREEKQRKADQAERDRRERERERRQRHDAAAAAAAAAKLRERSPLRNGLVDEPRVKEEPRAPPPLKEEYLPHPFMSRHLAPPPGAPGGRGPHYPPTSPWGAVDAYPPYPMQLRYNPMMAAALEEEQRAKMYPGFGAGQGGAPMPGGPPGMHRLGPAPAQHPKKEEPR